MEVILLHPDDNVGIATRNLAVGSTVPLNGRSIAVKNLVGFGHKIALAPIGKGEPVRKFGQIIGQASETIAVGEHVHSHNLQCKPIELDYAFCSDIPPKPVADRPRTFDGYLRKNGTVGTRNYIGILSTVNCSATVCKEIARRFAKEKLRDYPNLDGVFAATHFGGCAMPKDGLDRVHLNRVLSGFARHANVVDYILVGLGCETNQGSELIESEQLLTPLGQPARLITIQSCGGIAKTIDAGVRLIESMLARANDCRRSPQPASKIVLATECGGSDGNSGITANPALGIAADLVVAQGGTAVLSETTEIYGAEHLLTRRAVHPEVAQKLVDRIKWWEKYAASLGAVIDNNPSHGNKAGGLTTIYEKSLGAISKGGNTALVDVVEYAEPINGPGLVIMDTPGYDPASVTGLVAGGVNVVCFTTGRGSVFGCKPVPSIKIATNTPMFDYMIDDMDANAGTILAGESVAAVGERLFDQILDVASGRLTKSEAQGVGDEEFVPWLIGPML